MQLIERSGDPARVILTLVELIILNQAMNEVANGLHIADWEFSTRLGFTRVEVQTLLGEVHLLRDAMSAGDSH